MEEVEFNPKTSHFESLERYRGQRSQRITVNAITTSTSYKPKWYRLVLMAVERGILRFCLIQSNVFIHWHSISISGFLIVPNKLQLYFQKFIRNSIENWWQSILICLKKKSYQSFMKDLDHFTLLVVDVANGQTFEISYTKKYEKMFFFSMKEFSKSYDIWQSSK